MTRAPMKTSARRVRRWLLVAGSVLVLLVTAVLGVYGWAWLSTDESTIARAMIWGESDVGDQHRFPARRIPADARATPLSAGPKVDLVLSGKGSELDEFLRETDTLAFVVVHHDRLVRERYFGGSTRESLLTSFSVAKSFVSTLVGIAIDAGLIRSVDDPVTDYLPELAARDPRFRQITLRHLLTMSSGIRYQEGGGFPWPFGDDTYTYYGVDLRDVALNRPRIAGPPGFGWQYNNYHPLLLGLVLERTTGTSVSDFMARRLWRPLGAEADATWSLDSERSAFEKMESGVNARAVDYARFGLLFLHDGEWNGTRIVSKDWVRSATRADTPADLAYGYRYFWWLDVERSGRFYAMGKYGQFVYVAPDADAVVVRLGRSSGVGNVTWLATFRDVIDQLERRR
jgi:CubicO group peptidase (beta-lactamase class C family)